MVPRRTFIRLGLFFFISIGIFLACTRGLTRSSDTNDTGQIDFFSFPDDISGLQDPDATPFRPQASPTPDQPHNLPDLRTETEIHIVQPGESLFSIARVYSVTPEQIIAANQLVNPDLLEVGRELLIPLPVPSTDGPSFKIIPDAGLVYGPGTETFDVAGFIEVVDGYLARYSEEWGDRRLTGSEIVAEVAWNFSVNPRLLLALLDYQSGWLTRSNPEEIDYPMGLYDPNRIGLYRQLSWAADMLNRGYYLWRVNGTGAWILPDGSLVPVDPTINAGTAAVQHFFAQLSGHDQWLRTVGERGFSESYWQLYGNPFADAFDPLIPADLVQPVFQLPFEAEAIWSFTGGPHGGWGDGSAWAALDFAPPGEALGCIQSNAWVVALADGWIVRTGEGQLLQDLDGDGFEQTGWVIFYLHLESRDRTAAGTFVHAGDRLGHPSCEGGISSGTHLHIARKYNGEWISADQSELAFIMDGWTSTGSGNVYDGLLVKGSRTIAADVGRSDQNAISR